MLDLGAAASQFLSNQLGEESEGAEALNQESTNEVVAPVAKLNKGKPKEDILKKHKDLAQRYFYINYDEKFSEITGDRNCGIFLSYIFHMYKMRDNKDWHLEYLYLTRDQIQDQIGLSHYQQRLCDKKLEELGLIAKTINACPGQLHYKLNLKGLVYYYFDSQEAASDKESKLIKKICHKQKKKLLKPLRPEYIRIGLKPMHAIMVNQIFYWCDKFDEFYCSNKRWAKQFQVSEDTIIRAKQFLSNKKLIEYFAKGHRMPTTYTFSHSKLCKLMQSFPKDKFGFKYDPLKRVRSLARPGARDRYNKAIERKQNNQVSSFAGTYKDTPLKVNNYLYKNEGDSRSDPPNVDQNPTSNMQQRGRKGYQDKVKQEDNGKSWAYYSDPNDYSTHRNPEFFNEDKNLSKKPRSVGDKLEAELYITRRREISHNFMNMMVKQFAVKEPWRRFKNDEQFIKYAAKKISEYLDNYESKFDNIEAFHNQADYVTKSEYYCPGYLKKRRDAFIGGDPSKEENEESVSNQKIVKQDDDGKSWAYYSDPFDYSTHVNSEYFNENKNLSKRPKGLTDLLQAEFYSRRGIDVGYNYLNMMIKYYAITEPNMRFDNNNQFLKIAFSQLLKSIDKYSENLLDDRFYPKELKNLRDKYIGNDNSEE